MNFKEKRIREITFIYYSRPDIKKAIYDFSENRECIPRYFEGFGKRPDSFQYEQDVLEQVKKGATSFHCSEELWEDPLEISTELSEEESDELRIGWDFLLDIDSPYLEYSKIYTKLLVEALEFNGVKNFSVKFSGNKGFHIIVPWKAFPNEIYNQKTKNMFPEWPRIICEYLSEMVQPKLAEKIFKEESLKQIAKKTGKKEEELLVTECLSCKRPAEKADLVNWFCPICKNELSMIRKNKRIPKCPREDCRKPMIEKSIKEIHICNFCEFNTEKNPEMFGKTREKTEKLIEADLILVAPRHLFRMPYSLHEKTALASIVIDKHKVMDFQIIDAKPFKATVKNFYLTPKPNEARDLLLQALDWSEQKNKKQKTIEERRQQTHPQSEIKQKSGKTDFKQVSIPDPSESIFPPCIKNILKGIKQDGRKRALFILINFFKSLGISDFELEKRINNWNEKNHKPLKAGYIQSQLNWYKKTGARMPPNCDKPNYNDIAVCKPDELCRQVKNPVNYAVKRYFMERG